MVTTRIAWQLGIALAILAPLAGISMADDPSDTWQPKAGSQEYRPLEGGPVAAAAAGPRLVQMKALAARFTAYDDFKVSSTDTETTKHELRLLPTPVYRYEDKDAGISGGAVFAFVHGTDPEVFLVLESRKSAGEQPAWHYALAPMICWAVQSRLDRKEVWSVHERLGKSTPADSYHIWKYVPGKTNAAR
jgi:hypothetical protein